MEIKPEKEIIQDETLTGLYQGSVRVTSHAKLIISGTVQGSLSIDDGTVVVRGTHQGSVNISAGSRLVNEGALQGSLNIENGATVENTASGKLAGSINITGELINFGVRGGTVSGSGNIIDKPGSQVKQPKVINGMNVYNW